MADRQTSGTVRCFPELRLFDEADRRRFTRRYYLGLIGTIMAVCCLVNPLILYYVVHPLLNRAVPRTYFLPGTLGVSILMGAAVGFFVQYRLRAPIRRRLRRKLNLLGRPICMDCGYDLRGLTEPRCPECGRSADPASFKPRHPETGP